LPAPKRYERLEINLESTTLSSGMITLRVIPPLSKIRNPNTHFDLMDPYSVFDVDGNKIGDMRE
jgi:hypothetical protein